MAASWTLRAGRLSDVPAMYELDLVCFAEPFRFSLREMRRFVVQPGALVVVAEDGGLPAGFVVVQLAGRRSKSGYVVTLDVAPQYRRAGLARDLMVEAEQRAVRAGASAMALHVYAGNEPAIRFYERCGYERGERCADFYGQAMDAWVYEKDLKV